MSYKQLYKRIELRCRYLMSIKTHTSFLSSWKNGTIILKSVDKVTFHLKNHFQFKSNAGQNALSNFDPSYQTRQCSEVFDSEVQQFPVKWIHFRWLLSISFKVDLATVGKKSPSQNWHQLSFTIWIGEVLNFILSFNILIGTVLHYPTKHLSSSFSIWKLSKHFKDFYKPLKEPRTYKWVT